MFSIFALHLLDGTVAYPPVPRAALSVLVLFQYCQYDFILQGEESFSF